MKARVCLQAVPSYERAQIEQGLEAVLDPLGGMAAYVTVGQRVLIKPNMLAGKSPEKAVTTHPEVVRAVIRQVQRVGGVAVVGDSPGVGSPLQVAKRCGILDIVEETGAEFAPFSESERLKVSGKTFQEWPIARDLLDADVVINLPKLKTHQMMGMTCAVKNLFGAILGMRKPALHLQAGSDKELFALMLLELAEAIRPALSIVDAVTAMEGEGPGSGDPVHLGALLAGDELLAVDTVASSLLGLTESQVWTQQVARKTKRPFSRLEEIDIIGVNPAQLRPEHFRPAKATDIHFGLPRFLRQPLKTSLSALPAVDFDRCLRCGLCVTHCPPKAMTIEKDRLRIDTRRCIGCFCCQELCPYGALHTRQGRLLRLIQLLKGKVRS